MKKLLSVAAVIITTSLLTACNSANNLIDSASSLINEQISNAAESDENNQEETEYSDEADYSADEGDYDSDEITVDPNSINSWETLYNAYSEREYRDYDIYLTGDIMYESAFTFLSGDVDLAFTASFFGESAKEGIELLFQMLGSEDVVYSENGNVASVEITNSESKRLKYEVTYSGKTAKLVTYTDGTKDYEMTICVTNDYWAKSYTDSELDLHVVGYSNGDIYLGTGTSTGTPSASLLDNEGAASDPSFVTGMTKTYQYVGGTYTSNQ